MKTKKKMEYYMLSKKERRNRLKGRLIASGDIKEVAEKYRELSS